MEYCALESQPFWWLPYMTFNIITLLCILKLYTKFDKVSLLSHHIHVPFFLGKEHYIYGLASRISEPW
jgi:hypothetical protein